MTAYDTLVRAVPPPAEPVDARGDWTAVEARLEVRLPDDYKWLVETYGWGEYCDFLYLRTPFGTSRHNGLQWRRGHGPGTDSPHGLLIWGTTMDADRLCWRTDGEPGDWPVVVWGEARQSEEFAMGALEFVDGWARGRLDSRLLGRMEPDLAPWFNAFRPRVHRCLVLSEGPHPYADRLRILREALAPTADRGSWTSERGESGQDHFATVDSDWLLTYDRTNPHQIRVGFPPGDKAEVRRRLFAAFRLMGCEVLAIRTAAGSPLTSWEAETAEDREE
ncbi:MULTISPECIES: SMI1/KNR4 family protein [unclassified Streptomyces]|uniref:SMI1/KNR4 family protein n=1 Tax=unclassified Streptomyces TaxID=2593676 RepID=UPI00093B7269|nr:SMI1/KNR4 family protein [Streptomyces sp. TSRI0107]OKJ75891.1 hypothetical protein AMK31_29735 [Streptomyces sp. TSRI0107]